MTAHPGSPEEAFRFREGPLALAGFKTGGPPGGGIGASIPEIVPVVGASGMAGGAQGVAPGNQVKSGT